MDLSVLKLVFVFGVKDNAVLIQETHDRSLPPWTSQEVYDDVEEPILNRVLVNDSSTKD